MGETMFWTLKSGVGSGMRRLVTTIGFRGLCFPAVNPNRPEQVPRPAASNSRRFDAEPRESSVRDGRPRDAASTGRSRRWLLLLAALFFVVAGTGVAFYLSELDWTAMHAALHRVPAVLAIALMALL